MDQLGWRFRTQSSFHDLSVRRGLHNNPFLIFQ